MSLTSSPSKRTLSARGKGFMFILAAISAVVVVLVVFLLLSRVVAQTQYYVLNKDVAARTQITQSDLTPITVSVGGAPRSYTLADVESDPLFAKYNLSAGDVLTDSNVSNQLADLRAGLPNNFVVTSFTADPSDAASGKIQAGDYVDLYVVDTSVQNNPNAHLFLQRVLILDAQVDLNQAASTTDSASGTTTGGTTDGTTTGTSDASSTGNNAANSAATRAGVPSLFTVGLSPENAARLLAAKQYDTISAVISSKSATAGTSAGSTDVGASGSDVLSGDAPDAGAGTVVNPTSTSQASGATSGSTGTATNSPSTAPSATPTTSASAG